MMKIKRIRKLSVHEAFIRGVARIFDPFGTLNQEFMPMEMPKPLSDYKAMKADWQKVGEDLYKAIGIHHPKKK